MNGGSVGSQVKPYLHWTVAAFLLLFFVYTHTELCATKMKTQLDFIFPDVPEQSNKIQGGSCFYHVKNESSAAILRLF